MAGGGDDQRNTTASADGTPAADRSSAPPTPSTPAVGATGVADTTDTPATDAPATTATTTTAPATTSTAPATTTTVSPTANIPVDELPRHEAVYADGKLILQGTLPNKAVADRFRDEAAAVIGPDNVIVRYQFDPRVPVPTDGRVRVDDDFLFAKGSAAIDPRYEPLMGLGVAVMKLNPQARMRILGYTDDSGPAEVNARLSQARADALKSFLAINGIDPGRVDAIGRGEVDFVAPNDTEANRGLNRRIEVELVNLLAD
jgi:outer membrane protein OmpA-like peptidoglycan-associated protein